MGQQSVRQERTVGLPKRAYASVSFHPQISVRYSVEYSGSADHSIDVIVLNPDEYGGYRDRNKVTQYLSEMSSIWSAEDSVASTVSAGRDHFVLDSTGVFGATPQTEVPVELTATAEPPRRCPAFQPPISLSIAGPTKAVILVPELAAERDNRRIRDADVEDTFERGRRAIRKMNLFSLPFHHQVLSTIVWGTDEIAAWDFHDPYEAVTDSLYYGHDLTPVWRRGRRNMVGILREYDLIGDVGPAQPQRDYPLDESVETALVFPRTV